MRGVLLASLRRNTRRYVASTVAVVIGVAFVLVTNALSNATREGLTADVGAPFEAVDLVVETADTRSVERLMATAGERDLPAMTYGYAMEPVSRDGVQLTDLATVSEVSTDPTLQWQELLDGRFPAGPGEGLADVNAAKSTGVELGDVVRVGSGKQAFDVEVVGVADSPAAMSASLFVPWQDLSRLTDSLWVQAVAWGGSEELAHEVAPDAEVMTADAFVAARQAEISRGVDVLAIVALLFVVIALFVAVLVIANTFSILFAQRMRDFALLRCVGVTRRQLRRSVRLEALLLGLVSSALGVVVGVLTGVGMVALVHRWFDDMGAAAFDATWVVGSMVLGTAVTLAAAWLPTRAVTRVTPLAALRPDTGVDVRTAAGRWRIGFGLVVLLAGAALLVLATTTDTVPVMLAGGMVTFSGVLLLGPVLVPALIRVAGRLLGDGPVRRLATGNAVRNPRRTATTAASLLVGVTLTTAVLTGLATARTALDDEMDLSYPVDVTITAAEEPLADDLASRVAAVEDVADTAVLPGAPATVGGMQIPVVGVARGLDVIRGSHDPAPADDVVRLTYDAYTELPRKAVRMVEGSEHVVVRVGDVERELRVDLGEAWGQAALVSPATLSALAPEATPAAVWVLAEEGADTQDLNGDLAALAGASSAGIDGGHSKRAYVYLQVDVLTGAVVGLLGIAVVIALVGIANTLGLSVLERARENALLRAMGLTRPQLRRAMATEGLLLSVVATLLGTFLGVVFAWVGVDVMVRQVVSGVGLTVPVGQLSVVVAVSAVAGLAACILPARRAARTAPAAGLAVE